MAQEVGFEQEDITILEYFTKLHSLPNSGARKELAKVLFVKDDINKMIGALSGGEKSRLKLCSLMYEQVNLMILDEPTNHLDIDSREILEETLIEYQGTILFVSHDRYFIAKIANRMAEIMNYSIDYYAGNYDYYREQKDKGFGAQTHKVKEIKTEVVQKVRDTKKVPQKYLLEYEKLEVTIAELEESQSETAEAMISHASDSKQLSEIYGKNQELEDAIMVCYERWEELTRIISG